VSLLVAAAVAFVVASSVRPKPALKAAAARRPGVLPPGQRWEPARWEPAEPASGMQPADAADWEEGEAFVESALSIIGVLQKYPVAGGESCLAEMSGLLRRLRPLVGRTDAAARTERALLERRMEAAWKRAKDAALPLSA
jgi:hypothetical protein